MTFIIAAFVVTDADFHNSVQMVPAFARKDLKTVTVTTQMAVRQSYQWTLITVDFAVTDVTKVNSAQMECAL